MIKRFLITSLATLCMIILSASVVIASERDVFLNDVQVNEHAMVIDGITHLAVRHVAEHMGAYVRWYPETSQVGIEMHGIGILLEANDQMMLVDYRSFAPIETLAELFFLHVNVQDDTIFVSTPAHQVIGSWWVGDGFISMTFNEDGTGFSNVLGDNAVNFSWHTNGFFIHLQSEGFDDEIYRFSAYDDFMLLADELGEILELTRIIERDLELDPKLVGTWFSQDMHIRLYDDNAGQMDLGNFTWWVENELLHMQFITIEGILIEAFNYHFDNGALILQSQSYEADAVRFYPSVLHEAFVGSWSAVLGNDIWHYVFMPDGFGIRGLPGYGFEYVQLFHWQTVNDEVWLDIVFANGVMTHFEYDRTFEIAEEGLSMSDAQGNFSNFIQIQPTYADLYGLWEWEYGIERVFYPDHTGTKTGIDDAGSIQHFTWQLDGNVLKITATDDNSLTESFTVFFGSHFLALYGEQSQWLYTRLEV